MGEFKIGSEIHQNCSFGSRFGNQMPQVARRQGDDFLGRPAEFVALASAPSVRFSTEPTTWSTA